MHDSHDQKNIAAAQRAPVFIRQELFMRDFGLDADATPTRRLSRFLVEMAWDDLPTEIRHEAKRALLNSFAVSLHGSRSEVVERLLGVVAPFSGAAAARLVGRTERLDVTSAAFINGVSASVLDFDDTHFPTIMHPTATVAAPLFAFAHRQPMTGRTLLTAFILGYEAQCRIGTAVSPYHYEHGFHITASCGVFGAAAAIGRVIGLGEQEMVWAIGNAGCQSAGLVKSCGFMSKSIGVGNACRNGLMGALYAQAGVSSQETPLEQRYGFLEVMSPTPNYDALTEGFGESWELRRNACKAYPSGIVLHPVIDACLDIRARDDLHPDAVAAVSVRAHPLHGKLTDRPVVHTEREAVVSTQHTVAVALIEGRVGLDQYDVARVLDPDVIRLRDKVVVEYDPTMPVGPIDMVVTTTDGRRLHSHIDAWLGSLERPMSDLQIETKLIELGGRAERHCDTRALIDMVWNIEDVQDVRDIVQATIPVG